MYQKMLLSDKIADSIVTAIKNDFYKIGDQMPNEIHLAEELGVSRATLREAIKSLISQNVLEVRRGIGTFVSSSPGFSIDALGLDFLDLSHQINDIQRSMRSLDFEELSAYQHLSWEMQTELTKALTQVGNNPLEMMTALFETTEKIALYRQCSFKHRMILLAHEAYKMAIDTKKVKADFHLSKAFEGFVNMLGDEKITSYYDDFLIRVRLLEREE